MTRYAVSITLLFALAACGPEDSHGNNDDHGEVTPATDACEHMADGPAEAVTAGEGSALSDSHTRYDITLSGDPPSGEVEFEFAEETEAHFFFDSDVDLEVADASGTVLTVEESIATVDECTEVEEGFAYDLGVGTYTLTISGGTAEVGMVFVPGGEEAH